LALAYPDARRREVTQAVTIPYHDMTGGYLLSQRAGRLEEASAGSLSSLNVTQPAHHPRVPPRAPPSPEVHWVWISYYVFRTTYPSASPLCILPNPARETHYQHDPSSCGWRTSTHPEHEKSTASVELRLTIQNHRPTQHSAVPCRSPSFVRLNRGRVIKGSL